MNKDDWNPRPLFRAIEAGPWCVECGDESQPLVAVCAAGQEIAELICLHKQHYDMPWSAAKERVVNENTQYCLDSLRTVVNSHCRCGGKGPDDVGVCVACKIWHGFKALIAQSPTEILNRHFGTCGVCGDHKELTPYSPGSKNICFNCMKSGRTE